MSGNTQFRYFGNFLGTDLFCTIPEEELRKIFARKLYEELDKARKYDELILHRN